MIFDKDIDIPFTDGDKWLEIEIYNAWFQFSFKEIYKVDNEDAKRILGETDARTVFEVGFRIPFVKSKK